MKAYSRRLGTISAAAIAGMAISAGAAAQQQRTNIEEIVVTARLRAETLQSTPLSIAAYTEEQLENRGIDSLASLATHTPGVIYAQSGNLSSVRVIIRGLSQTAKVNDDVNVATFVDGLHSPGFSGAEIPFDALERVEVVRGPQSALYGRNSFAGAVNYITKRPNSHTMEYGVNGLYGENGKRAVSAYVSGPLVMDKLSARIDTGYTASGSVYKNEVDGDRLSDTQTRYVRAQVLATPVDSLEVRLTYSHYNEKRGGSALVNIPDNDVNRVGKVAATARAPNPVGVLYRGKISVDADQPLYFDTNVTGGNRKTDKVGIHATWDMGWAKLVSLSGYEERRLFEVSDLDTTRNGTLFGTALVQNVSGGRGDRHTIQQDLHLQSNGDGPLTWLAGYYFQRDRYADTDLRYSSPGQGTTSPPPGADGLPQLNAINTYTNTLNSVFGSIAYSPIPQIELSAEGRYSWETKRLENPISIYGRNAGAVGTLETDFKYFTPRFLATYKPGDLGMFYASVSKGTKSGGFNAGTTVPSQQIYQPEKNWTYELGTKWSLLNRTLLLSASVFYVDWSNQQVLYFPTDAAGNLVISSVVGNVGKTRVKGGELQVTYAPVRAFRIDAGYGYTDPKYKDAVLSSYSQFVDCASLPKVQCGTLPGSTAKVTTGRVDGNQLEYTSKHTLNVGAETVLPTFGDWDFYGRGDVSYQSKRYQDAANSAYVPSRTLASLRAGLQNASTKVQLYCDNVFDKRAPILGFSPRDFQGTAHYFVSLGQGRNCGVQASLKF